MDYYRMNDAPPSNSKLARLAVHALAKKLAYIHCVRNADGCHWNRDDNIQCIVATLVVSKDMDIVSCLSGIKQERLQYGL